MKNPAAKTIQNEETSEADEAKNVVKILLRKTTNKQNNPGTKKLSSQWQKK